MITEAQVTIKNGQGEVLKLTIEEAKALREELNEMFSSDADIKILPYVPDTPTLPYTPCPTPWTTPSIPYPLPWTTSDSPIITYTVVL